MRASWAGYSLRTEPNRLASEQLPHEPATAGTNSGREANTYVLRERLLPKRLSVTASSTEGANESEANEPVAV